MSGRPPKPTPLPPIATQGDDDPAVDWVEDDPTELTELDGVLEIPPDPVTAPHDVLALAGYDVGFAAGVEAAFAAVRAALTQPRLGVGLRGTVADRLLVDARRRLAR